jgi:multidrug resistance efflux pump
VDQPLAQIDDLDARMAMDVALSKFKSARKQAENEISVKAAEAQRDVYQAEWDVALETNKQFQKTISETEIRRLRYRTENARLQIDQAKFDLVVASLDALAAHAEFKRAEAMVEHRKIISPIDGDVAKVFRRKGNWVAVGEPVARVVHMDRLRVYGFFPAQKYARNEVAGKPVQIRVDLDGGGSETLTGTIDFASSVIDINKRFEVWAEIANKKNAQGEWILKPGLSAEMIPQVN